ncbi:ANR family transcriptional regulator [Pantoea dispersa]|uniref:ANR family transcriptional regulator n=1 Tax=Pantoea dispersa TaxID=59814 RepID=UPI001EE74CA5|nr:ANR family transcriptional regulator [Pantoea dispersa]UKY37669.1 ANR family transcriptional regulator [Pantoea dispersa]
MNKDTSRQKPAPYVRLAIIAAEAENAGAYGFAATAWTAAAGLARRDANRRWANERSALCNNALKRDWGRIDSLEEERHDVVS